LHRLSLFAQMRGDMPEARRYGRKSLELARELGDEERIGWALMRLSNAQEDAQEALPLLEEAMEIARRLGNDDMLMWSHHNLGWRHAMAGDYEQARAALEEGLDINRRRGRRFQTFNSMCDLGILAALDGRFDDAGELLAESLRGSLEIDAEMVVAPCLQGLAAVALARDEPEVAARLLGAADAAYERTRYEPEPTPRLVGEQTEARLRERLGDRVDPEREAGRALPLEEAVSLALGVEAVSR
jgi:hypothetical protein